MTTSYARPHAHPLTWIKPRLPDYSRSADCSLPRLIQVRRMIGVASFIYIAAHLSLLVAEQS